MGSLNVLTVIALAASAVAGPLTSSGPCARQCTESAKFLYQPGTSYYYDYESDVATSMQGTTREESRLHLKARVEIHAISKCDFIMRLSGVSLENSDPLNTRSRKPVANLDEFRRSLEQYTLRFSFQDGSIENICPADQETVQVLNIKRGILSVIQTSAENLESPESITETDVSGKCTANYEPLGRGWNSITVRKVKDLSTCTERHNAETAIQMNPFLEGKETKSTSLVKGNQDCKQVFKQNRLESVMCTETHLFKPFSRQDGGAMTKISQSLTYSSEKKTAFTGAEFSSYRKAMTYDHQPDAKELERRTRQVEEMMRDLCTASKDDIKPAVPQKFTALVYGLRQLEFTDLSNMYKRSEKICSGNTKAKKLFLDAVAMGGTSGSLKFVVDVMQRGEMSEAEIDVWIGTLAFVHKPGKESLSALLPLLDGKRLNAILPVSAVAHTYCRQNKECGQDSEVRQVIQKIIQLLGSNCSADKKQVMPALKALGNIGVAIESVELLESCVQNSKLDKEVRIAAIQAYRKFGCAVTRSPILNLYTKQDENVEVRIAAFLNIIRCPSEETLKTVKSTMEAETMKQVGSFVMSYLKNVEKKTALKRKVQEIVTNVNLLNKFESDIRKYSRNYKSSFHLDSLNSGADMESNVIFGTDSYLPRSATLNLTLDMMGASVNVFELEARAEGIDKMVEKMFGPDGYFRKDNSKSSSPVSKFIADNRIDKLVEKFDVRSNFEKRPSVSMDMKIFGNSLWYKKFQEGNIVSETFDAMEFLVELAKEHKLEMTKSFLFLDTTVHIPTGSGLPMKLAINGSAVMNLKLSGKLDARSLRSVDVHGVVEPSCAVTIETLMSVEAGGSRTALKMQATVHSSTALDGVLEIRGGKLWHASLNMPREQQDIIDVQTRIFLGTGEQEQNSAVEKSSLYTACSGKYTTQPLGVEMCSELQLPVSTKKGSPLYPFSGPARCRIFIRKSDPALTKYHMEMSWTEDKSGRSAVGKHLVMSFNTPGSKVDREISAEVHLNKEDSTFALKLKVPNKKIALTGKRVLKEDEKRISVAVSVDDQDKFSVVASMLSESFEGGMRYQPALEIHGPSSRLLNIRTTASMKSSKYNGEIIIEDLTAKPVVLNGEVAIAERNKYEISAMTESYALSAKVKGFVQVKNGVVSKLSGQYRFMDSPKDTVETSFKLRDLSASGLIKYSGAASLVSSAMPEITSSLSWETQLTTGHIENSLDLSFGDGRVRKTQKISMSEIFKYQGSLINNNVEGTFRLTYPEKGIDYSLQMNHKNTPETILNTATVKLAPGREASSLIDLKLQMQPIQLSSDMQLKYPGRELSLQGSVNQKRDSDYEASLTAQWQRGKQVNAVGHFKDGSTRNGKDYRSSLEMTIPNTQPISFASQLKAMPGQYLISADGSLGRDQYSVKSEYSRDSAWNHKASAMVKLPKTSYTALGSLEKSGETFTGKVDVNVPEYRRVTGNVELTNGVKVMSGSGDLMWDADRDQSRRAQMDAEVRLNADGNQGKFNLKSPVKTMSGSYKYDYVGQLKSGIMRGNLHTELEWERNQKITADIGGSAALKQSRHQVTGEIKISTPLNGYENLLLTVQHSDTWPEWNNKLVAQWKPNKKIVFGSEGKMRSDSSSMMLETSVRLNTPISGFETLSARQSFEKRPSGIVSFSSLQWSPKKIIELSVSGALDRSYNLRAVANLTTPFDTLQELSTSLGNGHSKDHLNSELSIRWNNRNSFSLTYDGQKDLSGDKNTLTSELKFLSTFRNYEKMIANFVYKNDRSSADLNSKLQWNNNQINVDLSGANRKSNDGVEREGKITYRTTFKNFESGELKLKHLSDDQKFSSSVQSTLPFKQSFNIKLLGNMPSQREMDSSLEVSSSFIDGIGYQVSYKLDKNRVNAKGEATYGSKKMNAEVMGSSRARHGSWEYDYKVNLNTPVRGFEEMKFSATQKKRDSQLTTRLIMSKNQDTYTLNHDLKLENPSNFENVLRVTSPHRNFRNAEITIIQNRKPGEFKHITEAQWGNQKASLAMTLLFRSQRQGHNFDFNLNAKSPFTALSSLDMELHHEDDEKNFMPKLSIVWNTNNKIIANGMLNNDRLKKVETALEASTSFRGLDKIVFKAGYDLSSKQKTAEIFYRWNERPENSFNIIGKLEADSEKGMTEVLIISPVRGYESIQWFSDYLLSGPESSVKVLAQWSGKKLSLNSKHIRTERGNQVNLELESPIRGYDKLEAFGSYTLSKSEISTELSYGWPSNKKVVLKTEIRSENGKFAGNAKMTSPFVGYREMEIKGEVNVQSPRKTASISIEWEPSKTIMAEGAFESDNLRLFNINMQLKTPFDKFKNVHLNGKVKNIPSEFSAEVDSKWMQGNKIAFQILMKSKGLSIMLDTPIRPYKDVRFNSNWDMLKSEGTVSSKLEWDNSNQADLSASYKISDKSLDGKVEVSIPLKDKQTYSASGSYMNDNMKMIEGKVQISIPNERYETSALIRRTSDSNEINVSVQGPKSQATLNGNLVAKSYRNVDGSMKMDSTIKFLPSFSVKGNYKNDDWKYITTEINVNDVHSVQSSFKSDDKTYEARATCQSPLIPSKKVTLTMKANAKDVQNIDGSFVLETPSQRHSLSASEKYSERGFEAELKVDSPVIRGQELIVSAFYNNNKNTDIQGKLTVVENRKPHTIEITFNNENRGFVGKVNIQSNALPSDRLDIVGKLSFPTDRSFEAKLSASSGTSEHSLVVTGSIENSKLDLSATLESPEVSPRPITLAARLSNEDFKNIDASVSLMSSSGESRSALNIKRQGWRDLEGSFTLDSPFEPLKMLRVNVNMRNEGLKRAEASLDIKSSVQALRMVSMSGKMNNAESLLDLDLSLKLPVRNWESISLAGSLLKNSDWSKISPKITFTLLNKEYMAYAVYENNGVDLQTTIGSEWENKKVEWSIEKHPNQLLVTVQTPFRGYERYWTAVDFKNERGKRIAHVAFEDPKNRKYTADVNLHFQNTVNFIGETRLSMPMPGLQDISTKLRHSLRRGRWSISFDHNIGNEKISVNFEHGFNPLTGTVQIVTPMEKIKTMKINYNWESSNNNGKMDVELNDRSVLHMEVVKPDFNTYSGKADFALPALGYSLSLSSKPLPGGYELVTKSVLPQRIFNFQTMYQASSNHFSHGSKLSLDERSGETLSYEVRSSPKSRQESEFYARLNMPVRSLELKTTHEKTSAGRTVSGDLYWDIARDQSKHMKLTLEHTDNSNRNNLAHKVRLIAAHPQLEKDIVLATEALVSPSEIHGKFEAEYSRQQQHNVVLEGRAKSDAQNRREKSYTVSLTAKHPVTNLDLKIDARLANNQEEMAAEMQLNYLDRNLRQQIQELRTKIQKVKQNIEIMARSNEQKVNFLGRMFNQDNQLTIALEQSLNDQPPKLSQFRWNQLKNKMDLNISSPFGGSLYVKAAMPDDHVEVQMGHAISGRQSQFGEYYLGLKNSRILESRIHWKPEAYAQAKESLSRSYRSFMTWQTSAITSMQSEISSEFASKSEKLYGSVKQANMQFINDMSKEIKKLRADSQRASNQIGQMYSNDAFYVRSSAGYVTSGIEAISETYETSRKYVTKRYKVISERVSMASEYSMNILKKSAAGVASLSKSFAQSAQQSWNSASKTASQLKRRYIDSAVQSGQEVLSKSFGKISRVTFDYVKWAQTSVSKVGKSSLNGMQNMMTLAQDIVKENPGVKALNAYVSRLTITLSDFHGQMVKGTQVFMSDSLSNIKTAYTYVRDHPNVNYINDVASEAFEQSRQVANELGLDTLMINILEEMFQKTHQMTWNTIRDLVVQYADMQKNSKLNCDPENGKIELEVELPVMKDSLKDLLDVDSYPQIHKLKEISEQVSLEDLYFWDSYYKFKRYLDVDYWVPPYKAQAMLVGSQHYLTFDDVDFDFAGECSYLLARDFVDGNFTVTVNYVRENRRVVKKSLNIYSNGVKIEVSRDSKLTVDDRKVELPQVIGDTELTLEDGVITVNRRSNYKLKCHIAFDFCTLQLNGFYFGKTGGLFGTNNYEPGDDMITPEKITEKVEEFSSSWKVGNPQCTEKRNYAEQPLANLKAKEICSRYFSSYRSELRAGFKQVIPDPFHRMCINDLSLVRDSEQMPRVCSTIAAYIERCREEGVHLKMPKHCVQCQRMNADSFESGDTVKITKDEPVRAADVVFIVEEKDCNRNAPAVLSKLAQGIDDGFRKKGYRQVNFAVVGFGGDGVFAHPHVVTSDSQVFGTIRNIDSALSNLPSGSGDSDIFMALRYAAGLPFMTGSTKTFVLSKCSPCNAHKMKADYSEIVRTMLDSDITLHLLMDHEFETRPPNKPEQAKRVLGFDMKHAFTTKDIKSNEIRGDRDLLAQLKKPKDLCVPLALEVSGSLFSMGRLQEKRAANKKTVEVLTKRILKTANPADCQICECMETPSGIGKSVCQRCVSPEQARRFTESVSPLIEFDLDGDLM